MRELLLTKSSKWPWKCLALQMRISKGSQNFHRLDEEQLMSMFADIEPFHKQQNPSNRSASNHTPAAPSTALDNRCSERQTISENPSMP
jgi:hypothetical protein